MGEGTANCEWPVDVIPPCTMHTAPANEYEEANRDDELLDAEPVEGA